jgi:hypothetical protein
MPITITDLNPIIAPVDADILVLDDVSEGTTKHITFLNLKNSILSQAAFESNASELVTALNAYDDGTGSNGLKSTTLWYGNAYRAGDYFLNYTNFSNTPTIPSNLDNLVNSGGFVKLLPGTAAEAPRLAYMDNEDPSGGVTSGDPTPNYISTANVPEVTGSLYYTDDRVEAFLDANFASYYNAFSSTFDQGNVRDSLIGVTATVTDTNLDSGDYQGSILRISDPTIHNNYSVGQTVRVYGADLEGSVLSATNASLQTVRVGFATSATDTTNHQKDFAYRIAEFNYTTGQVAPAGVIRALTIATPSQLLNSVSNTYEAFNTDNFIRLTISGVTAGNGVLVYRRTPETNDQFILCAVLGPKEVSEGTFIDYYAFDWVPWSGRIEADNTYPTSVIHFPRIAPGTSKRGWVDMTIQSKAVTGNNMDLTLNDVVFISSDQQTVSLAHNDTSAITQAISTNSAIDRKSVVLNAKTYVSSQISLPNNFGLVGTPYITKITKLPWSGGEAGTSSAKMIKTDITTGATNVSLVGVDLEGNSINQFRFPDTTDDTRNYAVDFGVQADGPLIDKVRIRNVIGGGIYADRPIDLRVAASEVLNSGVDDRLAYSPIFAYGGQKTQITANKFENFGEGLDVSNTDKGIVSDNLLNNIGSGLVVYGSKFFISSQNVLIGPAGEFLPTPDTLNSEFDMLNIDLTAKYLATAPFDSDVHVYQENGLVYDLTQTDGTISNVSYKAYYVEKLPNGGEQFWTPANASTITFSPRSVVPSDGQFAFTIPYADIADIKERTGSNSYTTLTQNTVLWDNLAADITTIVAGGSLDSDLTAFLTQSVGGNSRADVTDNSVIEASDATAVTAYGLGGSTRAALPENQIYRIRRFLEEALLDDASLATPTLNSDVLARYVNLGNPNHQGIVYTASYEHEVSAGNVATVVVPSEANGYDPDFLNSSGYYHITVTGVLPYLSLGASVTLADHGSSVDGQRGTITNLVTSGSGAGSTTNISIRYLDGSNNPINISTLGASGQGSINIIDKFVLAQGRIL